MEGKGKGSRYVHYLMALVGGFIAVYAILNRNGLLGNAQTMNLINLLMALLGNNLNEFILRLGALLIYIFGTSLTVIILKKTKLNIMIFSIAIDFVVVLLLGFLPENMNNVLAAYPIFFAMAVQWNAFKGVDGYISSSVFSTNNVRQMSISFTEYFIDRNKSHLDRGCFFAGVLLTFHLGAVLSYLSQGTFGIRSVWTCFIPLSIALTLVIRNRRSAGDMVSMHDQSSLPVL